MGITLQHVTGLHTRFTAHNRDQRSTFLESFLTHRFVSKGSVPKEQKMFLQKYSVASRETCVTKTF